MTGSEIAAAKPTVSTTEKLQLAFIGLVLSACIAGMLWGSIGVILTKPLFGSFLALLCLVLIVVLVVAVRSIYHARLDQHRALLTWEAYTSALDEDSGGRLMWRRGNDLLFIVNRDPNEMLEVCLGCGERKVTVKPQGEQATHLAQTTYEAVGGPSLDRWLTVE